MIELAALTRRHGHIDRPRENVFLDPRVQRYLATTKDPRLRDQLSPVSDSNY